MKIILKKLNLGILSISLVLFSFAYIEPNKASAVTDEITVNLTVSSGISITSPADVTMSSIGLAQSAATGGATWNVKTNDVDGYTLTVHASQVNAMHSASDAFTDYTETSAGTPETWSVSSAYEFGFSALGSDVENVNSDQYNANGETTCDNGVASSTINGTLKYLGFDNTTPIQIATDSSETGETGANSTICFAAEQSGAYAPDGSYSATITATATTL